MLYDYQDKAINQIREHYKNGIKKVLLHMPTGAGKTHVFSHVLKSLSDRNKRGIMVVRGRQLVDQASQRLFKEGVRHGVRMAGHWNKDYSAKIQICSIDTLTARENFWPEADLVVIDEAHMATSKGYHKLSQKYQDAFFLPVTATPYCRDPLTHIADTIVHPISVAELMQMGVDSGYTRGLIRPRYFAPSKPDMTGAKVSGGEWTANDSETRMKGLTGNIIEHWRKIADGRPTILFACNISHSKSIVADFVAAGIPAEHIEGDNSFAERASAIQRLERGEIKVLSNVGILCTGVDIPFLGAIIMARPVKSSYNLYIQQAGRGTRTHPASNKKDFLILDHAGNVLRHGFIDDEPEGFLDGRQKAKQEITIERCLNCYAIFESKGNPICPECNYEARSAPRDTTPDHVDGVLAELMSLHGDKFEAFIHRIKRIASLRGYKKGWLWHQVKDEYDEETANRMFPRRRIAPWFQ